MGAVVYPATCDPEGHDSSSGFFFTWPCSSPRPAFLRRAVWGGTLPSWGRSFS